MKSNHYFFILVTFLFLSGCTQPIGKSLLSSGSEFDAIEDTTSVPNDGDLDIKPDNQTLTVNMDDSDRVEVTGTCKDLDRKNNRILVEVFPGENETVNPYISNSLSDACVTADSGIPVAALPGGRCFWVTKGVGLIEEAGLPTEKSFPQCHNGRFGFSVKLGAILVNPVPGQPNLKYTIRFKLRTLDGLLADTPFSKVTVNRNLTTPLITSATVVTTANLGCNIITNAARFNQNILYRLQRTNTDITNTTNVYTLYNAETTLGIISGDSVSEWRDDNFATTHTPASVPGIVSGMTYGYTLTAIDNNFIYGVPPTLVSTVVNCVTPQPVVVFNPPATAGTCAVSMQGNTNPGLASGTADVEWGYNTSPNWIGVNADANVGFIPGTCNPLFLPYACTQAGLLANTNYFFAVRERNILDNARGKWSPVALCKTP
ncbi:MAG: hypothetical protein AABY53_04690 [Bdellovibrionota bacterium]